MHILRSRQKQLVLPGMITLALVCTPACDTTATDEHAWWQPFVEAARQEDCTDVRDNLFVIDNELVFRDRAGDCPDMLYARVLYGRTLDDWKCANADSIGGPSDFCNDPQYQTLFDTIRAHADEPDLGLGSSHHVVSLPL